MPLPLKRIKDDMKNSPPWKPGGLPRDPDKKYSKHKVTKLETLAAPGIKSLTHKAVVKGSTSDYLTVVQWFGVDFQENQKDGLVPVGFQKKLLFHRKPSVRQNEVKLKCSCDDFRFTFEKPLFDSKALIGTYRRYRRKTVDHPVRNQPESNGYCKHLHSLILALKGADIITE